MNHAKIIKRDFKKLNKFIKKKFKSLSDETIDMSKPTRFDNLW